MTTGGFYVSVCLLRIVLPLIFIICILMRQTGLSIPYLLLFFILPHIPLPTMRNMSSCTSCYLQVTMVVGILNVMSQSAFQIYLVVQHPYELLTPCSFTESILRQIGFIRLDNLDGLSTILMIAPDVVILLVSVIFYLIIQKAVKKSVNTADPQNQLSLDYKNKDQSMQKIGFLTSKSKYVALLLLCFTGALRPSVSSSVYFIVFLGGITWWACFKNLGNTFAVICRLVSFFAAAHVSFLLAYQTQFFQEILKSDSPYARYFGLTVLKLTNCTDPRVVIYNEVEWTCYVNPAAILTLYYTLSLQNIKTAPSKLFSSGSQGTKYRATSVGSGIKTDVSKNKAGIGPGEDANIQLQTMQSRGDKYEPPNCMELTVDAVVTIFQLLIRSSYIATNITMMAWSITYHSWLTFVLLLWASLLWMIPNQRRSLLRCSPYIVLYAECLLISQYIYGMDLTEDELPTVVNGVRLDQIGFYKPPKLAINPILIKTMFTGMFLITMRQFCQERWENKQSSILYDMSAPLHLSVGTASGPPANEEKSAWVKKLGAFVKKLMTKFWIWVVAISLFVIGVTGNRITVFRIVYMGLFLIFILTFQISYKAWRRMMYGFWLTVIIYSMSILVLVYTYQFENFPKYWEIYLHVPNELQLDIGLESFQTAELFVRLLAPTFFVVITVVQLHYFHKEFLAISDLGNRSTSFSRSGKGSSRSDGSSLQPDESLPQCFNSGADDVPLLGLQKISFRNLRHMSSNEVRILLNGIRQILWNCIELVILFLELHMLKIVIFSIMVLCCYNVAATHLVLVILCVVALLTGSKVQTTITLFCSIFIAFLLLFTMIYQIQYIQHDAYMTNCTDIMPFPDNKTPFLANNSEWLGFKKATNDITLINLLQGYIAVFAVITSHAVINTRQRIRRQETGKPKPHILFPGITREMADSNIANCLKYLINYGFYKFGVEICLITTVGVIGSRMDFYGLIYAAWLSVLFGMSRSSLSRIWNSFRIFIAVMICLQYLIVVGAPPGFCIDYPWYSSSTLRKLQNWMFLPDPIQPPSPYKILCDFILLILVCRQALGFRKERRHRENNYAGGSNEVIIQNYEKIDFENPYIDHMTYTKSSLDLLKKAVFSGLLWLTLAVTFTAGTSRVNILSLGYLIGSFIFLWQGNDLYLRRIPSILKWWNWLLGYNVIVILTKTILQIAGCMFMEIVQENACWVVQLLGIGCMNKFGDLPYTGSEKEGTSQCTVPDADIGLAWDGLCFSFLLMQRRFFHSYYFFHHIDETKAMTILQSRGAQLIEELRQQQLQEQQSQERKVLEKIRHKMDRIKASQQKVSSSSYKPSHYEAIRSGDYYMFEDIDDEELDLIKEDEDESSSEGDDTDGKKRFTMSKFLSTALKTDITKAADQALTTEEVLPTRSIKGRRASMPASMLRRKSSTSRKATPGSVLSAPAAPTSGRCHPVQTGSEIGLQRRESRTTSDSQKTDARTSRVKMEKSYDFADDAGRYVTPKAVKEKVTQKLWQSFKVLWAFFESVMVSMIRTLNKISKDYRYVVRVLAQEKREVKENEDFRKNSRSGISKIWKPKKEMVLQLGGLIAPTLSTITESEDQDIETETTSGRPRFGSSDTDTGKEEWSAASSPVWLQLVLAIWYAIISHSELVCYFVIFLHQIKSPTFLSLPLPLMVFLWGSLTMPRPTKTFWVTLIAYTEVVVIIKCLCQFELLPWNQTLTPENNPFYPPRIIGVEKKPSYASSDLLLLLIIFFHRYMLKSLGLWKSTREDYLSQLEHGYHYQELYKDGEDSKDVDLDEKESELEDRNVGTSKGESNVNLIENIPEDQTSDSYSDRSDSSSSGKLKDVAETSGMKKKTLKKALICVSDESSDRIEDERSLCPRQSQATFDKLPTYFIEARAQYCSTTKNFFFQLLNPGCRLSADVYAYMFICDFFNFLVVLFGFSAFGTQQGDGGVSAYLEENKVPVPFLLMMILQFALIVIDRALYLRKSIIGKIIFQFFLVIGVHLWMFFILPAITERPFNQLLPPQMWYTVKCFYLLMSAYQIRAGYPTRILGNFLCKKYNYINMFSFRGFMAVPFLFELRALMDWIWTDTSMTLSDWLKMEDIFAQIFQLKCQRRAEAEYPLPRGERKSPLSKYLLGGAGLFLIIAIIWFPLVLFALGNTVGESNIPYDMTITLRIGAYQYIYEMSAQNNTIYKYTESEFDLVTNMYKKNRDREGVTFLSNYQFDDVAVVKLSGNSTVVWSISPPDRKLLLQEVESNQTISLKFGWRLSRVSNNPEMVGVVVSEHQVFLPPFKNGERNPKRIELANMLKGTNSSTRSVIIENILPKFLKITNKGNADAISKLMPGEREAAATYRNISVSLKTGESSLGTLQEWWEVSEMCDDDNYKNILSKLPHNECGIFLTIFTFNDKAFPATLSFISGKGIIGLYVSIVFVMWTLVRGFFTGISSKIMFDDMPNVDRILQLCLDIYLVRESNEFALEEDLFAKLVFLYRSPETIIKWTKERKDMEDEYDGGDGSQLPSVEN